MEDHRLLILTRLMDAAMVRQQVHAGNLANQNTPGYKARAVAFEDAFNQALRDGDLDRALALQPDIYQVDATSSKADGNDVSSAREVAALAKNKLLYDTYIQIAKGSNRLLNTAMSAPPG